LHEEISIGVENELRVLGVGEGCKEEEARRRCNADSHAATLQNSMSSILRGSAMKWSEAHLITPKSAPDLMRAETAEAMAEAEAAEAML
jgi:hypothetical protein